MTEERFRPFFFPEFGWIILAVGMLGLAEIGSNFLTGDRRAALKNREGYPWRLLAAAALYASAIVLGIGLVVESRLLGYVAMAVAAPSMLYGVIFLLGRPRERSDKQDATRRDEDDW